LRAAQETNRLKIEKAENTTITNDNAVTTATTLGMSPETISTIE